MTLSDLDINNFIQCLDESSGKFRQNLNYSIDRLGTATFLDIIQKGLQSIGQNKYDDTGALSTIKSITHQLKYQKNKTPIKLEDILHTETSILCAFLSVYDQINLKQTCHQFNVLVKYIDINQHEWIGISYDLGINELHRFLDLIRLEHNTFNKVKMIGEAQYDWDDVSNTSSLHLSLGLSQLPGSKRSHEESQKRKDNFRLQMGYWLFIVSNICANKGIFITPKLEIRSGLGTFISQIAKYFADQRQLYQNMKYCKAKNNIPRKILFQANDGDSVNENGIQFFLEKVEMCFENIKSLFEHNREIKGIFIVRKYIIFDCDIKFREFLLKRCGFMYGKEFGDAANKFVGLKRSKNGYFTLYLKFKRTLINSYTPNYSEDY